jgi:DNA invertase Pin-like site-specific DNA recombinase
MRGRPGDVDPRLIRRVKKMREDGMSYGAISKKLNMPRSTVRYHAAHTDVRAERNERYRKSHPVIKVIHCTSCLQTGHNAANCNETVPEKKSA